MCPHTAAAILTPCVTRAAHFARTRADVSGRSNSGREIEFRSSKAIACDQMRAFFGQFPDTQAQFSWVTQSRRRELPRKLPRFCAAGSELCRSLANVISDQFESATPVFPVF